MCIQKTYERAMAVGTPHEWRDDRLYRRGVVGLLDNESAKDITNGLPSHAVILYQEFISRADKIVRIYCQNLAATVFNNAKLVEIARNAIERGVELRILVEEDPDHSGFTEMLKEKGINVWKVSDDVATAVTFNFFTMDKYAFRYESDRSEIKAIACGQDRESTRQFNRMFDSLFCKSDNLLNVAI